MVDISTWSLTWNTGKGWLSQSLTTEDRCSLFFFPSSTVLFAVATLVWYWVAFHLIQIFHILYLSSQFIHFLMPALSCIFVLFCSCLSCLLFQPVTYCVSWPLLFTVTYFFKMFRINSVEKCHLTLCFVFVQNTEVQWDSLSPTV